MEHAQRNEIGMFVQVMVVVARGILYYTIQGYTTQGYALIGTSMVSSERRTVIRCFELRQGAL